jgi:hypothetical protein
MRHKECIFDSEDICPKNAIDLTCDDCIRNKSYEIINMAVKDFTGLGESFTTLFAMLKKIIDHDGKTVEITTPVSEIVSINRAMTTVLSKTPPDSESEKIYRRLMFYFFKIIAEEFESAEYETEKPERLVN